VPNRRIKNGPFSFYVFVQATGTVLGRFLPIDGNTFTSSRSGQRDDFYQMADFGATMSYKRLVLTYRTKLIGNHFQEKVHDYDYSSITLSYEF